MIINQGNLDGIYRGFSAAFNQGFTSAPTAYASVAMTAPSSTRETTYAWMGQIPRLREWLGERVIKNLNTYGYTIQNRKFESTVEVQREDIEDDSYGVYGPLFTEMGRTAAEHPDELVFSLLANGFTSHCYDGQYFFDSDHPTTDKDGAETVASNIQAGEGVPWFLFDTSRAIKPLIFQRRLEYELQRIDRATDENVFMKDLYLYGVRARANAGFGLWQLAYGSMAALTPENYAAARAAMMALRGDEGRLLGVTPDTLVVPPFLEAEGRQVVIADRLDSGASNVWAGSAKLITTAWLAE